MSLISPGRPAWLGLFCCFSLLLPGFPAFGEDAPAKPEFPRRNAVVRAVERTGPSVVNISTEKIIVQRFDPFYGLQDNLFEPFFRDFFGRYGHQRKVRTHSLGSGVILDENGYIVTNEHVIRRASRIQVTLADKTELEAKLVSADPENDLAVLKIPPSSKLVSAPIGISSDLMIGETAIALGNPFGLENSVSVGVISATNRSITVDQNVVYRDFIQTDAAVNPGNSGGPLLNINGEVIGINTAVYAEGQGISFAIPVNKVMSTLEELLDYRMLKEIWIGVQVQQLTPEMSQKLDYKGRGIIVSDVISKSPASGAGLQEWDIITRVNSEPVKTVLDFKKKILALNRGDKVKVDYMRSSTTQSTSITLEAVPKPSAAELTLKKLGLKVQTVNRQLAKRLRLRTSQGLLITEIERNGPAHRARFHAMDVIIQIDRFRISNTEQLGRLLQYVSAGAAIRIIYVRGDVIARTLLKAR